MWSHSWRVIERDGPISLPLTVHHEDRACWTCKERISYLRELLAEQHVPCFWTREPDDDYLYVTVGPLPQDTSVEKYLWFLLLLPIEIYQPQTPRGKGSKHRRQTKSRSCKGPPHVQ